MYTILGFNQIQFEGFYRFIGLGLTEELYKFPKMKDINQEIEFQFFVETCQLVELVIKDCGNMSIGRTGDKRKRRCI